MSVPRHILFLFTYGVTCLLPIRAAPLMLQSVNLAWRSLTPEGLSGITYAGGDRYYAVDDSGAFLYPMTIPIDRSTGAILTNACDTGIHLEGNDLEGIAYNPVNKSVYTVDETGSLIREQTLSGKILGIIPVPQNLSAYRNNFGLESLSLRNDTLALWTSNEEALANKTMGINDGSLSTTNLGSPVRLTCLSRSDIQQNWTLSGQWAYQTDPIQGGPYQGKERSGVADLCALPDGTLLVLERELSTTPLVSFKSRIYHVTVGDATNIASITSLQGAVYTRVKKILLWSENTVVINFEGLCLGPELNDGSLSIILISDGDQNAGKALYALRLSGLDQ